MTPVTFSQNFSSENEKIHLLLYQLHDDICWKALKRVKKSLTILHILEVSHHYDGMSEHCKKYIHDFEQVREQLDKTWKMAAELQSRIIHENGCTGACQED